MKLNLYNHFKTVLDTNLNVVITNFTMLAIDTFD